MGGALRMRMLLWMLLDLVLGALRQLLGKWVRMKNRSHYSCQTIFFIRNRGGLSSSFRNWNWGSSSSWKSSWVSLWVHDQVAVQVLEVPGPLW